eukprot:UN4764
MACKEDFDAKSQSIGNSIAILRDVRPCVFSAQGSLTRRRACRPYMIPLPSFSRRAALQVGAFPLLRLIRVPLL